MENLNNGNLIRIYKPKPMKKLLIILAMFLSYNGFAQNEPWSPYTTKWIYGAAHMGWGSQIRLSYLKDTLLLGQKCQILKREVINYDYRSKTRSYEVWSKEVTYYKSGVAYIFNESRNKFDTLYYFSAKINDKYNITSKLSLDGDVGYATVVDTGSFKVNSRKFKWLAVDYKFERRGSSKTLRDTIIGRVGSTKCYYLPWDYVNGGLDWNQGGKLNCCQDWTFGIYTNSYIKGEFSNSPTSCEFDFKLGISAKESKSPHIFPNPADSEFLINLEAKRVDHSISIYTASGQLVKLIATDSKNDKIKINTSSWSNGLYVVVISNKFGTQKEKVLVNHPNCDNQ